MKNAHAIFTGWFVAVFSCGVMTAETVSAAECTCQQHDAKATGDSACSRTETSSYCTISFGSSTQSRPQVMELLDSGIIQGTFGLPATLSPFTGSTADPVDAAYRVVNVVGRAPHGFDLTKLVPDAAGYFTTALMINFALTAVQQDDTRESFVKAMSAYFIGDQNQSDQDIFNAFTMGQDTELSFNDSKLVVRYGCAALTYGDGANTIVVANNDSQGACE